MVEKLGIITKKGGNIMNLSSMPLKGFDLLFFLKYNLVPLVESGLGGQIRRPSAIGLVATVAKH